MLRYVRYALAVVFALLAVGFVALWVRSYTSSDAAGLNPGGQYAFCITSYRGAVWVQRYDAERTPDQSLCVFAIIPTEAIYIHAPGNGLLGLRLFRQDSELVKLSLPHWFLALSSLALAALLAFKRTWRFSLRSVLVATTILAGLLGLAVWAT